jgi:hypothetical protein
MNSTDLGNNATRNRDQVYRYDSDTLLEIETELVREFADTKQHRPKRSSSSKRRKAPTASGPGCGMAGRRNRRWSW